MGFIQLVYGTLKGKGIDTKGMSTDEAIKKFKELNGGATEKRQNEDWSKETKDYSDEQFEKDKQDFLKGHASGKVYSMDELLEMPLVKRLAEESEEENAKYGNTSEINTPERAKLREDIKNKFLSYGSVQMDSKGAPHYTGPIKKEHKAVIVIGLPASGKSTRTVNPISQQIGAFVLDSDEVKELIPEFVESGRKAAGAVHEESGKITDSALKEFLTGKRNGENLIIPKIGDKFDKLKTKLIDKLESAGYDVEIKFNDADPNRAANNMIKRAINTGRMIPLDVIKGYGDKPREVFKKFKGLKNAKGKPFVR